MAGIRNFEISYFCTSKSLLTIYKINAFLSLSILNVADSYIQFLFHDKSNKNTATILTGFGMMIIHSSLNYDKLGYLWEWKPG